MKTLHLLVIVATLILPSILFSQNVGIGEPAPSEKLDVNGRIVAKGYKNTILTAAGSNTFNLSSGGWVDAPDLSITFTLQEPTTVISFYNISFFASSVSDIRAETRLVIDGTPYAPSTNSCNPQGTHTFTNQYTTELTAGSHTVKVQCLNNGGGTLVNFSASSIHERRLQLLIFGAI